MRKQAERWGAELHQEDAEFVNVKSSPFVIRSSDREVLIYVLFLLYSIIHFWNIYDLLCSCSVIISMIL
jgi:hypothetical protein